MLRFLRSHCASHGFGPDRKRFLYLIIVRPHLGYASEVWAAQSCISDLKIIESVLRRVTRYILNCSFYVNRRPSYTSRNSILKSFAIILLVWMSRHNLLFEMHEGRTARITSPLVLTSTLTQIGFTSSADLSMRPLYSFRTYLFRDSLILTVSWLFGIIRLLLLDNNHPFLLSKLTCTSNTLWNFDIARPSTWKSICPRCRSLNMPLSCWCLI